MAKSPVAILYTLDENGDAVPLAVNEQGAHVLMVYDPETNRLLKEMVDELKAIRGVLARLADEEDGAEQ